MTVTLAPARLGASDVLVLRALGLGDALTGIPALRGLRRRFPERRLILAGSSPTAEWLTGLGIVDAVVPTHGLAPLRVEGRGHVAVDLHGRGPKSHLVMADTGPAELLTFASPGWPGPPWLRDEHEVDRWCRLVSAIGAHAGRDDLRLPRTVTEGEHVVVHPGAASAARRWPVERWAAVVAHLASSGTAVVLTGSADERELCNAIAEGTAACNAAGTLSVPALADTVAGAKLVVCGDTGVAHLATAFGRPSILLFGPTPPRWWGPVIDATLHTVLWPAPDGHVGDPHGRTIDPVLQRITAADVIGAVEGKLR